LFYLNQNFALVPNVVVESSNFMDEMQPELQSKIYINIKFIIYFF